MYATIDPAQPIITAVLRDHFSVLPPKVGAWAKREMAKITRKRDDKQARYWLRDLAQYFRGHAFSLAASDDDLKTLAEHSAKNMAMLWQHGKPIQALVELAQGHGITAVPGHTEYSQFARLTCTHFWHRQLKHTSAQHIETILRNDLGLINRRQQLYVSDEFLARSLERQRRNRGLMEAITASNDLGQTFTLQELSDTTTANQAIRRAELMTRIAGFEHIAIGLGHAGEFFTLTCPSRFHRAHYLSGEPNVHFDGSSPVDANAYLQKLWGQIHAALYRDGIKVYGFRTAEPHHEGCPHWHGLLFMPTQHVAQFRRIFARYACRADRHELGLRYALTKKAAKALAEQRYWRSLKRDPQRTPPLEYFLAKVQIEKTFWAQATPAHYHQVSARIQFKAIDWNQGSAVGYIAKYIAKNTDGLTHSGHSAGTDDEADQPIHMAEGALRARAWASLWHIRQFQQIGGPPVGVWRELRRLRCRSPNERNDIELAAHAADKGDWGKYTLLMGGPTRYRKDIPLKPHKDPTPLVNRYQEPRPNVLRGVTSKATGLIVITRQFEWTVNLTAFGRAAAPWTCVNNSTKIREKSPQANIHGGLDQNFVPKYPIFTEHGDVLKSLPEREKPDFDFISSRGPLTPEEQASINAAKIVLDVLDQPSYRQNVQKKSEYTKRRLEIERIRKKHFPLGGICGEEISLIKLRINRYTPGEYQHVRRKTGWIDYSAPPTAIEINDRVRAQLRIWQKQLNGDTS